MKKRALEIHRLNDEFIQTKNHLDLECLNHFQEMRLHIDLHNWELKEKLDDIDVKQNIEEIASEMIEKIKEEIIILNENLKEKDLIITSLNNSINYFSKEKREHKLAISIVTLFHHYKNPFFLN